MAAKIDLKKPSLDLNDIGAAHTGTRQGGSPEANYDLKLWVSRRPRYRRHASRFRGVPTPHPSGEAYSGRAPTSLKLL